MAQTRKSITRAEEIPRGFKLRHTLRGHKDVILSVTWSPDGRLLASTSVDRTIRVWDPSTGTHVCTLGGHLEGVNHAAWSPTRSLFASSSFDRTIRIWSSEHWEHLRTLTDHTDDVPSIAWSPDGRILASCSVDKTILLWNVDNWDIDSRLLGHTGGVHRVAWSPDGSRLASCSYDGTIRIWESENGGYKSRILQGHSTQVISIAWSPDGHTLASSSFDRTIRIWDPGTGRQIRVLEGHTDTVRSVFFSSDGRILASNSNDETVKLWRCDTWEMIGTLDEVSARYWPPAVAFAPTETVLATLGEQDTIVRIWDLDRRALLGSPQAPESVHYTTAKIALVGDSGVGKTGLGWRIAHGKFKEQASTHGQQFWVVEELGTTRADGTECQAVLWDHGGQPDYRIIHSLFLDDVDLALVLFDPSRRENPLSGVEFWLKQLSHSRDTPCSSILVGARIDRGTPTLTQDELEKFCRQSGIMGGYISTSALQGVGLPKLMEKIKDQIPWNEMPATVTTSTFKRVKEYVLSLKEDFERKRVLVSPGELRQRLEHIGPDWQFSDDEMMTAVRHLQRHGYVRVLRSSSGEESILLFPDLLINLASSFVLETRRHPRGFGVLVEDKLLLGSYRFPELDSLTEAEQKTLLDAATALFLGRNLCFRETFNEETFLVFPSLINEKRPRIEEAETLEDVSYRVSGAVENVYATLVVLLGYTNTFIRTNQWQNQAQYQLGANEVCGFRQAMEHEGEIELVLYYSTKTPEDVRLLFQGMFERFLRRRDVSVVRYPPVVCPKCKVRLNRAVVREAIQRGRSFLYCTDCGHQIAIRKIDVITGLSSHARDTIDQEQAVATRRTAFETALVRVKAIRREQGEEARAPSCFISYSWGVPEHETWVLTLARDLRNAGIDVILDRWHNTPGTSITRFIERISLSDYVVSVGTPRYLEKYNAKQADPVVSAELMLINTLLRKRPEIRQRVIPLLLDGEQQTSFPLLFEDSVFIDFRNEELYFVNLFNLILTLYEIPFDHPAIENERESMRVEATGRRGARL